MQEPLQNFSNLPKKIRVFPKRLPRISQRNGINEKGVKGMPPLGCLPLWGSEGVTLVVSGKNPSPESKNQMNFCTNTVSKTPPFFIPTFLAGRFQKNHCELESVYRPHSGSRCWQE
jgi:hypothetical protein